MNEPDSASSAEQIVEQIGEALAALLQLSERGEGRSELLPLLKARADYFWGRDPRVSLLIAQLMQAVGTAHEDSAYIALGQMASGDALRFLNRIPEAHTTLEQAGRLFTSIGDDVGWARTRIGRLLTSQAIGGKTVSEALGDVDQARKIFLRHRRFDLLVRLSINLAYFHETRSEFPEARTALEFGLSLVADDALESRAKLLHNLGILEYTQGNLSAAQGHYDDAERLFRQLDQPVNLALVQSANAEVALVQGRYRRALLALQTSDAILPARDQLRNRLNMLVCYQLLGAHDKASLMAAQLVAHEEQLDLVDRGTAYMYWGNSLAELDDLPGAIQAFYRAEALFREIQAQEKVYEVRMRRARAWLTYGEMHGIPDNAIRDSIAEDARSALDSQDLFVRANATLALGLLALAVGDMTRGAAYGLQAARDARRLDIEDFHYSARIFLARLNEARQRYDRASRHYERANSRIVHLQRDLTMDFRPSFLRSNQASLHGLIRGAIRQGDVRFALETIEAMKTRVISQYFVERQTYQLEGAAAAASGTVDALLRAYGQARERYLWLVNQERAGSAADAAAYRAERRAVEQKLTDLSANIRLHHLSSHSDFQTPDYAAIAGQIAPDTGVVEYYSDGRELYAFTFAAGREVQITKLPITYSEVASQLDGLRRTIGRALAVGAVDAVEYYFDATLAHLQRLYEALVAPLRTFLESYATLQFIPFGVLHSAPFHLLHDGSRYCIENGPIGVQPASGIQKRTTRSATHSGIALGYSGSETEFRMEREAEMVAETVCGKAYTGKDATSQRLQNSAAQILHIAAHGKHNFSQPRLSHVRLADGFLYVDDLWKYNLEFELVTLSACSVGLGHPTGGDELIGLGHGFLYSGAAALVSSLWDVDDETAELFNRDFYARLRKGQSTGEAVRATQLTLKDDHRFRHPAYWGAFQLVGSNQPLVRPSPA